MKEIKQTDPDEYTKWYSVESEKVKTNTPVIESSVVSLTNFRYALNHHTCNIMNAINRMYSFLYTSWYCWSNRDETEGTKINSPNLWISIWNSISRRRRYQDGFFVVALDPTSAGFLFAFSQSDHQHSRSQAAMTDVLQRRNANRSSLPLNSLILSEEKNQQYRNVLLIKNSYRFDS